MKIQPTITLLFVTLLLGGSLANAASLTYTQEWLHSQNNGVANGENVRHDISVFDGSAGYAGTDANGDPTSGVFGDGTVTAYRFFTEDAGNNDTIVTYAQRGTIISDITTNDADGFINGDNSEIWTVTDPLGFTSTPDYGEGAGSRSMIFRGLLDASGTIDISGLTSGNVYFLYGGYRATQHINVSMTGGGNTPIEYLDFSPDSANNYEHYVLDFAFVNDAGYDTISFNFDRTDQVNPLSSLAFTGIVVDGVVPEPSSSLLMLLGGLVLAMRRRR